MNTDSDLAATLRLCIAKPKLHRRLLHTFALMENIGARKIHRFQRFGYVTEFVLRHAAEESRHALYFLTRTKLLGLPTSASLLDADDLPLAEQASRQYLRRLDLEVNKYLRKELSLDGRAQYVAAYLLVTMLIEQRAASLYPMYEKELQDAASPVSIASVIAEEELHLAQVQRLLEERLGEALYPALTFLQTKERDIFKRWMHAMNAQLQSVLCQ